jgi:hypothetical protein
MAIPFLTHHTTTQQVGVAVDPNEMAQGLVMESMDCGWDHIVYSPLKFPLTWALRLQVLIGISQGEFLYS